eukprot:jgi/Ulvmu1/6282/UM028_0142.1
MPPKPRLWREYLPTIPTIPAFLSPCAGPPPPPLPAGHAFSPSASRARRAGTSFNTGTGPPCSWPQELTSWTLAIPPARPRPA